MGFWRVVFTIILPPLGVLLGKGLGWAFILNILLTIWATSPVLSTHFGFRRRARYATVSHCRSGSARLRGQIAVLSSA